MDAESRVETVDDDFIALDGLDGFSEFDSFFRSGIESHVSLFAVLDVVDDIEQFFQCFLTGPLLGHRLEFSVDDGD